MSINRFALTAALLVASGHVSAAVLYSQLDNASGTNAVAQKVEAMSQEFDTEGADDFVIPNGTSWSISNVSVSHTGFNARSTVNVIFYTNNAGLPGTATCTYNALPATNNSGALAITLPTSCQLSAGTHWMGIQVNQDFSAGQVGWNTRSTLSNNASAWRNPGNGFGSGCTTFAARTTCNGTGGVNNPDNLFSIEGSSTVASTEAIPTLSEWGMIILSSIMALFAFAHYRRRGN
jgi:hypothetical protein